MANEQLIMALGKVIIAAAWADGKITHEEINSLKDLLFRLPDMTRLQWAELDMYIETPVDDAERERLVEDLRRQIRSGRDRELALEAIGSMIEADGEISESEREMLENIQEHLTSGSILISGLKQLVTGSIDERSARIAEAPNREAYYDDYVKNKVFYEVQRRLRLGEGELDIPEDKLRKLSLAGGLMAQIARVHAGINEDEVQAIAHALEKDWHISRMEAAFVAQVATSELAENLDYMRTAREFYAQCSPEELLEFLDVLFDVAASDGMATMSEIEEIRRIARSLLLSHEQFIAAKVKIPRDQRET